MGVRNAKLRQRLEAGPWCWPREEDRAALDEARALVGGDEPALPPGAVPLVAVQVQGPSIGHLLRLRLDEAPSSGRVEFGAKAERAWRTVAIALPRSLPVLWHDVRGVANRPHVAEPIVSWAAENENAILTVRDVDGESFGLAFLLAMASRLLGSAVPADLIATGGVSPDGRVTPVGGVALKCRTVEARAPRIRRILVPAEQEEEARAAVGAGGQLEFVAVKSASQAVLTVFGEEFRDWFRKERWVDPKRRTEIVDFYFRAALRGRQSYVDWVPLAQGAGDILSTWNLDGLEQWRLELARGVADRHSGGRHTIRVPSPDELASFPLPMQVSLVTQLVQHSADVGAPAEDELEPLVREWLELPIESGFKEHLALRGAWARRNAVCGRPREALLAQRDLAYAFVDRVLYEETSHQLSEWFRLAGALTVYDDGLSAEEARRLAEEAEELRSYVRARAGLEPSGEVFVDLARARGRIEMSGARVGRFDGRDLEEPLGVLRDLISDNVFAPAHVQFAARRWSIAALDALGRTAEAAELLAAAAEEFVSKEDRKAARVCRVLVALDRALRNSPSDRGVMADLVEQLREEDRGPIDQLERTPGPARVPEVVACLYPY